MKVNESQIAELYAFTRKHFVEHYDLQTELVDHLAMAIEKQWEEKPHLSFKQALQIEFKKFGVFGFMGVVEERQKALSKKYSKLIWKHLKEYFKLPKILLTAALTYLLFLLISNGIVDRMYMLITLMLFFVIFLVDIVITGIKERKKHKQGKRKWMFEEMITRTGYGSTFSFLPVHLFNVFNFGNADFSEWHVLVSFTVSFLIVMMFMVSYVVRFEIPAKAQEYLEETYPEYKLVQ